jgi:hypothetical protein
MAESHACRLLLQLGYPHVRLLESSPTTLPRLVAEAVALAPAVCMQWYMFVSFQLALVNLQCELLRSSRIQLTLAECDLRRQLRPFLVRPQFATRVSVNYKESNTFSQKVTYSIDPRIK